MDHACLQRPPFAQRVTLKKGVYCLLVKPSDEYSQKNPLGQLG